MPEVRIDPLSGFRTIVASDRASRPGGGLSATPPDPIDTEKDPFLAGHEDQTPPETYALRANGAAPDTPGWRVRVVPNLYPALDPDSAAARAVRQARPLRRRPRARRPRGRHQRPRPRRLAGRPRGRRRSSTRSTCGASGCARTPRTAPPTCTSSSTSAARPARRCPTRTRRSTRWTSCPPSWPASASASAPTPSARWAATSCRTSSRRRSSCATASWPSTTTRSSWPPTARGCPSSSCSRRACRARRFEDDGPTGAALLHDGLRRLGRKLGNVPPLNLWVRTAPLGAEHFCWRIDVVPRLTHMAGLELGTGVHLNIVAPEQAAAELREVWCGAPLLSARARAAREPRRRARRRRDRRLDRRRDARPAGRRPRRRRGASATGWPTRSPPCGSSPTTRAA